jgi:hypothetical protein
VDSAEGKPMFSTEGAAYKNPNNSQKAEDNKGHHEIFINKHLISSMFFVPRPLPVIFISLLLIIIAHFLIAEII